MTQPAINELQREMAVSMLANALRKDAHLRSRVHNGKQQGDTLAVAMASRRAEPSQRYAEGMRDLLRVLFADGNRLAEECLEEAYARAIGAPAGLPGNSVEYQ